MNLLAWWEAVRDALKAALNEYGVGVVLLVLAVGYLHWRLDRSWRARLHDKDQEIKRMAEEKRRLEDIVLKDRLSTETKPGGKAGGKK